MSESLQDAIFSEKTSSATLKSCALRDVPEDGVHLIGRLVSRVLLGYLRPENFASEIQKETGIDALKAGQVAHDLDTEIFSAVRLELKKLYPPAIQTPTIQSPGFVPSAVRNPTPTIQQPAPKYIVSIPEKFLKQNAGIVRQKVETKEQKQEQPPAPPPQQTIPPKTEPAKIVEKLAPSSPAMKPVVPLPTFIQSKFKPQEKEGDARQKPQGNTIDLSKF
ncbi:hypothetical protein HYR65_02285 [Candidatus Azambacteria bacterium]|nr:hypothetical protein [Candidatus Azambacteria bacterium]